jgi:hypothetical protein
MKLIYSLVSEIGFAITGFKSNYRPVSILPVISKFFERAINDQLVFYFSKIVHPYLSAFRSGYGC